MHCRKFSLANGIKKVHLFSAIVYYWDNGNSNHSLSSVNTIPFAFAQYASGWYSKFT